MAASCVQYSIHVLFVSLKSVPSLLSASTAGEASGGRSHLPEGALPVHCSRGGGTRTCPGPGCGPSCCARQACCELSIPFKPYSPDTGSRKNIASMWNVFTILCIRILMHVDIEVSVRKNATCWSWSPFTNSLQMCAFRVTMRRCSFRQLPLVSGTSPWHKATRRWPGKLVRLNHLLLYQGCRSFHALAWKRLYPENILL